MTRHVAEDAGRYFKYMAEFVDLTPADANAIKRTKPIIAKHLPQIVAEFYEHLLRYPPTRKFSLKRDGALDHEYIELRMRHQVNFWLRTADGIYDDDYARFVDYVGRAHTSRGADPHIYIAERYVIGMVGFVQHAIGQALREELGRQDEAFEDVAEAAWDKLLMVILEMLSRAYGNERTAETYEPLVPVDEEVMARLAARAFQLESGSGAVVPVKEVWVAHRDEVPEGERKIVQVDTLSIGVFHHEGSWYALENRCLHRAGPVATGPLEGDTLTCPWHGFQYNLVSGELYIDPAANLEMYPVIIREGGIYLQVPDLTAGADASREAAELAEGPTLKGNEFCAREIASGQCRFLLVDGRGVVVYNVDGTFHATSNKCTHAGGPLERGDLEGSLVVCPWHDSAFDVTTGKVVEGPAKEDLKAFRVVVDGEIGRIEDMG